MIKARGQFFNRRHWVIDMNKTRQLYLGTYSRIDSIDNLIKNFRMKYRCWKYWHSPMIHTTSLVVVVDYYMYLEAEEGELDQTQKDKNVVEFWKFCDILSNQMLKYNPNHRKCAVRTNMKPATHQNQAVQDNSKYYSGGVIWRPIAEYITLSNFKIK